MARRFLLAGAVLLLILLFFPACRDDRATGKSGVLPTDQAPLPEPRPAGKPG
jgi:hypothetical protein